MKIRQGNSNPKYPSLIVGVPKDVQKHMGIGIGSEVTWSLNTNGRWELIKIPEAKEEMK
jgi:antitoxin component of MazEF toxin-antitoxin module